MPTRSASFCIAAQCSAVIPSPCAAFTSPPCLSSVRTVSRSPFMAASATGVVPAATSQEDIAATATTADNRVRMLRVIGRSSLGGGVLDPCHVEEPGAVAELLQVLETHAVQQRQHGVRHRRAVGRL